MIARLPKKTNIFVYMSKATINIVSLTFFIAIYEKTQILTF
jgi:hypothetical protein